MSDVVFRRGERVLLRPLERAEIPTLRRWVNDPEVTQFLMQVFPIMEKEEEEWFDNLAKNRHNFVLGIVERKENKLIGVTGLHNIHWQHRTATTGAYIGDKEDRGKGYGQESKMLMLDFAFNTLDLFAIRSSAMAHNIASLTYLKRCGYVKVGRIPNWIRCQNGSRSDEVLLVVTQERWRPLWQEYLKKRTLPDSK